MARYFNLVVALPFPTQFPNELDFWNAVRAAMRSVISSALPFCASVSGVDAQRAQLAGAATPEESALLGYPSLAAALADVRYIFG